MPVRPRRVSTALVLLLALMPACSSVTPQPEVAARVAQVSEDRLRAHVEALCAIGPRPADDAAQTERTLAYLEGELRAMGYAPFREPFELELFRGDRKRTADGGWVMTGGGLERATLHNLIVELPGHEHPEEVVEICAHYDTVFTSPGADDNSSGVAGLLEVARVVRDAQPRRTLRFCLFAAEELDLDGSRAHLATLSAEDREHFVALIDLEMIGYADARPGTQTMPVWLPLIGFPDIADFVAVLGTFSTGWLGAFYEDAIDAYVPELDYWSGNRIGGFFADARRSDHAHYWDAGLPAIMVTDTSEFRNDHYHRASDLPETLDYGFLRQVTQATVAAALHLADDR